VRWHRRVSRVSDDFPLDADAMARACARRLLRVADGLDRSREGIVADIGVSSPRRSC
jgi:hypothetical protein